MKKILGWLMMLAMLACGCAAGAEGDVWMYAVSAGKADAILVGVGESAVLVDAGYPRSRGKILAAMEHMGVDRLEAVFVTHTDDDHVEGLEWLAESEIEIGAWYASAMYIDVKSEEKHPAVKAAKVRGQRVNWLQAGDSVPLGGAVLDVLAPLELATDKDDNNSLVMMLRSADGNILLAGDIEFSAEDTLLASGAALDCDVLKVANHADDDTTGEAFVRAASPQVAVISTSTEEKPETPDPRVISLLKGFGAKVAVTQECTGGILVRLSGGAASVEKIDLDQSGAVVAVEDVVAGEDIITLYNGGDSAQALDGWYLYSDKGKEMFLFPEGATIGAGQWLVIGTNSTQERFDLLWDDKKVINKSKTDVITLYDANGMAVSSMSNGF